MMACMPCLSQDADQSRRYDAFFLEAVVQREKGNADAAFDLFRHCIEIDSTRSEAYYYLALYYSKLRKGSQVLAYLERAARQEPDNAFYLETLAETYINTRHYDEAIVALEQLYSRNRDRDDVLGMLVQLYEEQHDYENAIRTLELLEQAEGRSERLSYAKSGFYTKMGNKKAAIAEMKKLADQYPHDLNYRAMYANTLYANGQFKKALTIYEEILREEPDNRSALMALWSHHNEVGDSAEVAELTDRILTSKGTTSQDRILLMRQEIGRSEDAGGDSTRVLQLFHRILDRPQIDADVALLCATYMRLKQMPTDSIAQVLDRVLDVQPDNAGARLQLISYAWQDENVDRIIELCQAARQYNPDEMAFYYYQGIAYYKKEQLDDALQALQTGVSVISAESDPTIVSDFYAIMGDILHQKGMDKAAFAAYDSCLQWKDNNIGCLNNYAYYLSELGQQLDKAERMSYRTIKAEPKNPTYLDTYAWVLFMQERYSEAKIYIDQTLQCDSDSSAVMLEHAGDIYFHAGAPEQALQFWQKALAKAPDRQVLIRKVKLKKYLKE